jgi:hypothetical protein
MALIFMDSFDHVAAADVNEKWYYAAGHAIDTSEERNGAGCLKIGYNDSAYWWSDGADDTWICGVAFKTIGSVTSNIGVLTFRDSSGNAVAWVEYLPSSRFRLTLGTSGAGFIVGTSSVLSCNDQYRYIELKLKLDASTGYVELRVDEENIMDWSGDTLYYNNPAYTLGRLGLGDAAPAADSYYDDLYLCDGSGSTNNNFLGDCKVLAVTPDGVGTDSDFTPSSGNNYECVDELTPDGDTSYVESNTLNHQDSYDFTNLSADPGTVRGVALNLYVKKIDSNQRKLKALTLSGATEDLHTYEIEPGEGAYRYYQRIWEEDPDAAAAWTITTINAAEFGMKVTT